MAKISTVKLAPVFFVGLIAFISIARRVLLKELTGRWESDQIVNREDREAHTMPRFPPVNNKTRWIVVNLLDVRRLYYYSEGYLAFLDDLEDWNILLAGEIALTKHGCKKCASLPPISDVGDSSARVNKDNLAQDHEVNTVTSPNSNTQSLATAIVLSVARGAEMIYMVTSLHDIGEALRRMAPYKTVKGLIYTGSAPFNPCSYFAQPLFGMNRTFPECFDANWDYRFLSGDATSNLLTGLCEDCGKFTSSDLPGDRIFCDPAAPNVIVKHGRFVKGALGNALWKKNVFWALFYYVILDHIRKTEALPVYGVSQNNTYGKRYGAEKTLSSQKNSRGVGTQELSVLIQRLLWELRGSISFIRSDNLFHQNPGEHIPKCEKRWLHKGGSKDIELGKANNLLSSFCNNIEDSADILDEEEVIRMLCISKYDSHWSSFSWHLRNWVCADQYDLTSCVNLLFHDLRVKGLVTDFQRSLVETFLGRLASAGYKVPKRPGVSPCSKTRQPLKSSTSRARLNVLMYWPGSLYRMWSQNPFHDMCKRVNINVSQINTEREDIPFHSKTTQKKKFTLTSKQTKFSFRSIIGQYSNVVESPPRRQVKASQNREERKQQLTEGVDTFSSPEFTDIILVVVFKQVDSPQYIHQTQYLHFLYGRHFRHIIICGSGFLWVEHFAKMYPQPLTYIDLKATTTETNPFPSHTLPYTCVSEAMRMRYHGVRGYIQIDSDTLFNPWTFSKVSTSEGITAANHIHVLNKPWLSHTRSAKLSQAEVKSTPGVESPKWTIWSDTNYGRDKVKAALLDLKEMELNLQMSLNEDHHKFGQDSPKPQPSRDVKVNGKENTNENILHTARVNFKNNFDGNEGGNKIQTDQKPPSEGEQPHIVPKRTSVNRRKRRAQLHKYKSMISEFLAKLAGKYTLQGDGIENATAYYALAVPFYYVPETIREEFILLVDEFYKFNIHADLAVPTILTGLGKDMDGTVSTVSKGLKNEGNGVLFIDGKILHSDRSSTITKDFNRGSMYLYPWHFPAMLSADRSRFMCKSYLPILEMSLRGRR